MHLIEALHKSKAEHRADFITQRLAAGKRLPTSTTFVEYLPFSIYTIESTELLADEDKEHLIAKGYHWKVQHSSRHDRRTIFDDCKTVLFPTLWEARLFLAFDLLVSEVEGWDFTLEYPF